MVEFYFQRLEKGDSRLNEIYKLRYQVYCTEWGFENPEDYPAEEESDIYDEHSVHFCACVRQTGEIIGTARIILPCEGRKFPIEEHCSIYADKMSPDPSTVGEISRFAISKEFRRRAIDQAIYADREIPIEEPEVWQKERRRHFEMEIVAGLYQCIYTETTRRGLTHWYAVMAKGLSFLMRRWGILWTEAGPAVEYHGLRSPYVANVSEVGQHLQKVNPYIIQRPVGWID